MNEQRPPEVEQSVTPDQQLALSAHDAMRSRHWRFWLGLFHVLTGVVTGYLAVVNTLWLSGELQTWQAAGQRPPAGPLVGLIVIIVGFGLVSIAGVFVGIWNLMEMKSGDRRPLLSAIVVSMVSFVLMMTFIEGLFNDPAKIVFPILHAVVAAWTVGILRLKKVPVSPAVVV